MLPASGLVRALAAVVIVASALAAGVAAAEVASELYRLGWNAGRMPMGRYVLLFVAGCLLTLTGSNLAVGARIRLVATLAATVVGACVALYVLVVMGAVVWSAGGDSLHWWFQPVMFIIGFAALLFPAVLVWRWPRVAPRDRRDTYALLAMVLLVGVFIVPWDAIRLLIMSPEARHAAAQEEFGDAYARAIATLEGCETVEEHLGADAALTISVRPSSVQKMPASPPYARETFDFNYRTRNGEAGRITIATHHSDTGLPDASPVQHPPRIVTRGPPEEGALTDVRIYQASGTTALYTTCPPAQASAAL